MSKTDYETVVGLEIHAELMCETKMYCGCKTSFGEEANTNCCPVCLGMPGALPVINKRAVELAVMAGLALNCKIAKGSHQDRKNYFYPDLPKAYQISQFDEPLCRDGYIDIKTQGGEKRIRIERIHIEEDAGKLIHDGAAGTLIDFNRCSVPLIEIVTEPDIEGPEEARTFLEEVKAVLECTGVCDCKMEQGSLRCDINISVRPKGQKELGQRTEMKNVNSFRAAYRAIENESARQIEMIKAGKNNVRQTRKWDDLKGESILLRSKEDAPDYRFFPEPDLPLITLSEDMIERIRGQIPELPSAKRARYIRQYSLSEYDAFQIAKSVYIAKLFEKTLNYGVSPKIVCNWLMGDVSRILKEKALTAEKIPFEAEHLAKLVFMIEKGEISNTAGKVVVEELFKNPEDPEIIVREMGLLQISDEAELEGIVAEIIAQNPQSVADYKAGKERAVGYIIGQAMRKTNGKANPTVLKRLIKEKLDKM